MGGLASSAVYLATSLASGPPLLVPPDPAPAVIEAPAATETAVVIEMPVRPPARPYVIVDLPPPETLGAATGLDIRPRDVVAEALARDSTGIDADVVALHERRIGVLRERIGALRQEKAGQAAIAALDMRLKRAEAARHLAAARVALARCGGACAPSPVVVAKRAPVAPAATRQVVEPARARPGAVAQPAPALALASVRGATAASALTKAAFVGNGVAATRASADPAAASLGKARRLLAQARAALTEAPQPPIQLAGLWQWEGSERWSLAARTPRNA